MTMISFLKTHWRFWITPILLGAGVTLLAVILFTPSSSPKSEEGQTTPTQHEELVNASPRIEDGGSGDSELNQKHSPVESNVTVDAQLAQGAGADGDAALPTIPFIFVSLLGAQTGGFSAFSESFYVGEDGHMQVSEESSDGRLHRLRHGLGEAESFFEGIIRVSSAQNTEKRERAIATGEVTDYFPPKVVLAYDTPSGEYLIKSYSRQQIPESDAAFADSVTALRERPELAEAEPGLYIRAQHLPRFDPRIQKPDLVIDVEEAVHDANLWNALRREMALVRVGSLDEDVLIAGRLALRPKHPVHVQVGDIVYRIITYAAREHRN